jgi:hypothetical protein
VKIIGFKKYGLLPLLVSSCSHVRLHVVSLPCSERTPSWDVGTTSATLNFFQLSIPNHRYQKYSSKWLLCMMNDTWRQQLIFLTIWEEILENPFNKRTVGVTRRPPTHCSVQWPPPLGPCTVRNTPEVHCHNNSRQYNTIQYTVCIWLTALIRCDKWLSNVPVTCKQLVIRGTSTK